MYALEDTVRFTATVLDQNGQEMSAVVEWSSGDEAVVTVDASGLATAAGGGEAVVTASVGAVGAEAAVTVEQRAEEVRVSPDTVAFFAVGDTVRLTAVAADANGHEVAGAVFEWSSGDESVVTVDASGLATAVGSGEAAVTASVGAVGAEAAVTVEQRAEEVRVSPDTVTLFAVGDTLRLTAVAADANGHEVAGAVFEWSSGDEAVVTVDASGLAAAVGSGEAVVTATIGDAAGSIAVAVFSEQSDREILELLYHATGGEQWDRNDSWLTSSPLASWYGIATNSQGRVVEIVLPDNNVRGHIPRALGGLEELQTLTLGTAFKRFSCFSNTAASHLPESSLPIPFGSAEEFYPETTFGLAEGGWPVPLPNGAIVGQSAAARSYGRMNRLAGGIPPELGRLTRLQHLDLTETHVEGPIPPELGGLAALRSLLLGKNDLSGPIPPELWRLANLEYLHLFNNARLGWTLPPELGNLVRLIELDGVNSDLTGEIPSELGNLARVERIGLNCNSLSGPLPPELGRLTRLQELGLSRNSLSGTIPPELGRLTSLRELSLTANYLTGSIPRSLGEARALRELYLGINDLTGRIPQELGRLVHLERLHLHANELEGDIPAGLWNLGNLIELILDNNRLEGRIPPDVGNLTELGYFTADGNNLEGEIPAELARLHRLWYLDLGRNQLTGEIPASIQELDGLKYLGLNGNQLRGGIPPALGNLPAAERLYLDDNQLSGRIPHELGRLENLRWLGLSGNQLEGGIPPELGNLEKLRGLAIGNNPDLRGPLPQELTRLPLTVFRWSGTGLCADRGAAFRAWLDGLSGHIDFNRWCTLVSHDALSAFFESTGGSGWSTNTNWLTDEPVANWHGIVVEDSLVTALLLPDNGLTGTLPPEFSHFLDLKRLDLRGNRIGGRLPAELGSFEHLEALDIGQNEFAGVLPGTLAKVGSLKELNWTGSGACAPRAKWFETWLTSLNTATGPRCADDPFLLSVEAEPATQGAQAEDGSVPLIAGRPAILPVSVAAGRPNLLRADARVTVHAGAGRPIVVETELGSHSGLAEATDPDQPELAHGIMLPGDAFRPGAELVFELDPNDAIRHAEGSRVRVPARGRLRLDVLEPPPMRMTIVPVMAALRGDSSVVQWIQSADDPPIEFMRTVLPVGEVELAIREPLVMVRVPDFSTDHTWEALIEDIALLRSLENGDGYWYGVVPRSVFNIIAGMAQLEGRVSVGFADEQVFVHEIGHNMSLLHAPCGNPWGLDPDFPYPDGSIGRHSWDPRTGEFVEASTPDLMSYCGPGWISDFNFRKALEYRFSTEAQASAVLAASAESRGERLLLRGGVSPDGELRLDPAFLLDGPTKLPEATGRYRIEGLAANGASLFAFQFDMVEHSNGGGGFHYLVPFDSGRLAALSRVVLSGPAGRAALDRNAPGSPMAILIDPETGRVRSILRDEDAEQAAAVAAASAPGRPTTPAPQVLISYGLPDPAR